MVGPLRATEKWAEAKSVPRFDYKKPQNQLFRLPCRKGPTDLVEKKQHSGQNRKILDKNVSHYHQSDGFLPAVRIELK
jgi:hypothetical protein